MRPPTRRGFLAAGIGAAAMAPGGRVMGANERVNLGFIGTGGMGTGLVNIFKGFDDARVAAVCDVYEPHRTKARDESGASPDVYDDFRRVLDRKDVDAVAIATPDHWHAIIAIMACQAGKDVYCEKPLGYRIAEGRAMVNAAEKHGRVTQMGNLIHAGENYRRVVEIVRSGVLGPISKARVWIAADRRGLGHPPDGDPPAGCDYDKWLGPAPVRPFNPNRFTFDWRYHWDYAGGILLDFCCHIVDLVHWAMEVDAPATIVATGGRYVLDDNAETPDTLEVVYHYDRPGTKGFDMVWSQTCSSTHGFEGKGLGILFQGTEATLAATYDSFAIFEEPKGKPADLAGVPKSLPRSPGHHREWIDAIKTRSACSCAFEYGHRLTTVGHLGNIALWTGQALRWDAAAERVTNVEAANAHLARAEYRAPWSLPQV